jgi:hypothetical protein
MRIELEAAVITVLEGSEGKSLRERGICHMTRVVTTYATMSLSDQNVHWAIAVQTKGLNLAPRAL